MMAAVLLGTLLTAGPRVVVVPTSAASFDLGPVLSLMKEPPLENLGESRRVFRFFWLPPFLSQRRICVRVQDAASGFELEAVAVTSDGKVDAHVKRLLTQGESEALASAREIGFWKYQPEEFPQPVTDGVYWIIEGQAGGERLRVVQHVPRTGAFHTLGVLMFRLSGITLRPGEGSLEER